jgi:hypothetical protein
VSAKILKKLIAAMFMLIKIVATLWNNVGKAKKIELL